ncbi:hypothetical protein QE388_002372 [Microbacterium sp. SORGH_AS 969]|nr:hypothetical protein [Microbacterium sp. SORGH_AS_0969]
MKSGVSAGNASALVLARGLWYDVVPPDVAVVDPLDVVLAALDHEHVLDGLLDAGPVAVGERLVDRGLEGRHLSLAPAAVGGDDELRAGVVDAGAEAVGREAAEHDRVHGSDAGDGEHRRDGLGNHRQVDRHAVAALDPQIDQDVGEAFHLVGELGVGDVPLIAGLTLPPQRDAVAVAGFDVAVEAVVGDVQLAVGEPLRERRVRPVQHSRERRVPVQVSCLVGPESLAVGRGALVETRVGDGVRGELRRRGETAGFIEEMVDLAAHRGAPSRSRGCRVLAGIVTVMTLARAPDNRPPPIVGIPAGRKRVIYQGAVVRGELARPSEARNLTTPEHRFRHPRRWEPPNFRRRVAASLAPH